MFKVVEPSSSSVGYDCGTTATFYPTSGPSTLPNWNSSSDPWLDEYQVQDLAESTAATASNGKSMVSFSLTEDVVQNGGPTCSPSCTGLGAGDGILKPAAPFYDSHTACNGQTNYVSPTSTTSFNGSTIGGQDNPILEYNTAASSSDSYWDGTGESTNGLPGYAGVAMELDSLTCLPGPVGGNMDATLPTTFFTGGSAAPTWPTYCGLIAVNGWPGEASSTNNPSFTAGTTYSLTFSYQGGVQAIGIDPGDEGGAGPTMGSGAQAVQLGTDGNVAQATGSPRR